MMECKHKFLNTYGGKPDGFLRDYEHYPIIRKVCSICLKTADEIELEEKLEQSEIQKDGWRVRFSESWNALQALESQLTARQRVVDAARIVAAQYTDAAEIRQGCECEDCVVVRGLCVTLAELDAHGAGGG